MFLALTTQEDMLIVEQIKFFEKTQKLKHSVTEHKTQQCHIKLRGIKKINQKEKKKKPNLINIEPRARGSKFWASI